MPTLFNVNGPIGYQTWKDYCADLKDSKLYEWLTDKDMAITMAMVCMVFRMQ